MNLLKCAVVIYSSCALNEHYLIYNYGINVLISLTLRLVLIFLNAQVYFFFVLLAFLPYDIIVSSTFGVK